VAGRFEEYLRLPPLLPGSVDPDNPRSYPTRPNPSVTAEVLRAERQHDQLEASAAMSGQADALVIAQLVGVLVSARGACTMTTWAQGPTTVLPVADVVALFELPRTIDADPQVTYVRWNVLARVCGSACWRWVPDLDPPRVITRRWPADEELQVVRGLSLPEPRLGGPTPPGS
jgi:hypothetical protein